MLESGNSPPLFFLFFVQSSNTAHFVTHSIIELCPFYPLVFLQRRQKVVLNVVGGAIQLQLVLPWGCSACRCWGLPAFSPQQEWLHRLFSCLTFLEHVTCAWGLHSKLIPSLLLLPSWGRRDKGPFLLSNRNERLQKCVLRGEIESKPLINLFLSTMSQGLMGEVSCQWRGSLNLITFDS